MKKESSEINKIIQILDRIRRRLGGNYLLSMLLKGLTAGSIAGCLFNFFAVWHPVLWQNKKLMGMISGGLFLFLVYGLFHLPDRRTAAIVGDQCGLKERLLTAYENREGTSSFVKLQRKDALEQAKNINWKQALPMKVSKKQAICFCLSILLAIGSYGIPSVAKETAQKQEGIQREVMEKIKETEVAEKAVEKAITNQEALHLLQQQLKEMKLEMKQAKSSEELKKAQERLMWKLKKDIERLEKDGTLDSGEAQKLMAQLSKDLFQNWEREIASGKTSLSEGGDGDSISQENDFGTGGFDQNGENGSGNSGQNGENGSGNNEQNGEGGSGNNEQNGEGGSGNNGQNGEGGSGNNGQNGEGGSGNSGQNGENGLGNNGQNGEGDSGNGWNYGSDQGKEEEALKDGSMVSVPLKEGNDAKLNGDKSETGNSYTEKGGAAPIYSGSKVPYQQVLEQYTDEAYEKIDQRRYPENVQEIIKKYFTDLNE